jgi:hypothetical protein
MAAIPAFRAAVTSTAAPGAGAAAHSSSPAGEQTVSMPLVLAGVEGPLASCFPAERHGGHVHPVHDEVLSAHLHRQPRDVTQADPPAPAGQHADPLGHAPPARRYTVMTAPGMG